MNDKRFKELLEKALAGSITVEEEKELLQDYIKPETAEVFPFIQLCLMLLIRAENASSFRSRRLRSLQAETS